MIAIATVTPRELEAMHRAGKPVRLIDVRTPVEFREVHAVAARNVPLDALDPQALLSERPEGEALYFICRSGSRGRQACEKMLAAGCCDVVNVDGGTQAWEQAGLPVVRGKKAVSLERQVRIAAGSLGLLGSALALLHPAFLALPAFIGAGLVFAGLTDTCGMGMLLAKMPWNRVKPDAPACCAH